MSEPCQTAASENAVAVLPEFALYAFGKPRLERKPTATALPRVLDPGKPLALITYLACSPRRAASRDHLTTLLWADRTTRRGLRALSQTLQQIKKVVGPAVITANDGDLELTEGIWFDRDEFLRALDGADRERAIQLYDGPFLPRFAAPGGAEFEHWADLERRTLRRAFERVVEGQIRHWINSGLAKRALPLAHRLADDDEATEQHRRALLEVELSVGESVGVVLAADRLTAWLSVHNREPEPATRVFLERVHAMESTAGPTRSVGLVAELVGRQQEFATILSAWAAAQAGVYGHVHVMAPAGLGKTRLLGDVRNRLRGSGAVCVSLRANPGSRNISLSFAADLATALADVPGALGIAQGTADVLLELNPKMSGRYPANPPRKVRPLKIRHHVLAFEDLLDAINAEQPIALLLDDVHWIDRESADLVAALAARLQQQRVLLVSAGRPAARKPASATVLELRPLTPSNVVDLVATLGSFPDAAWAHALPAALHNATGGSPLLILETLQLAIEQAWLQCEEDRWTCPDPSRLFDQLEPGGALRRRIHTLDAHQRWILTVLTASGGPIAPHHLARIPDTQDLVAALQVLERRGFVMERPDGWTVGHDEIADAVSSTSSDEQLTRAHAVVGAMLAQLELDPPTVARAAQHLAMGRQDSELRTLFTRWVGVRRRQGDATPVGVMARALLGGHASPSEIRRLERSTPWHLRVQRPRVAAATAGVIVTLVLAATALSRAAPTTPDVYLYVQPSATDGAALSVPLRLNGWTSGTLDPAVDGHARSGVPPPNALPAPGHDGWILSRTSPDTGAADLYLIDADRSERRLTFARADDGVGGWSPDGQWVVFATTRWKPYGGYDLAIMDVATGLIEPLAVDGLSNEGAIWSPDGSRIAFSRSTVDGAILCWTTPDRSRERCYDEPPMWPVSWSDHHKLLVATGAGGATAFLRFDLGEGTRYVVRPPSRIVRWAASNDGRWIAHLARVAGLEYDQWYVWPVDRPQLTKRLVLGGGDPAGAAVWWSRGTTTDPYVDRIEVTAATGSAPAGTEHRLAAFGRDVNDAPTPVGVVQWTTDDSSVATIDADGVLRAKAPGVVGVRASAGGWRVGSLSIAIEERTVDTIVRENWKAGIAPGWIPYGVPRPDTVTGPDGVLAFWNRGDANYMSGVYSRAHYDASAGLGVEVLVSTPLPAPPVAFHTVQFGLVAIRDHDVLDKWDHRTRGPPFPSAAQPDYCLAVYPPSGWRSTPDSIAAYRRRVFTKHPISGRRWTGEWYRLRVQIFPDGTCGIAVDHRPVVRSRGRVALDETFHLVLEGRSLQRQVLVGPVVAWRGVRPDVNWAASWKEDTVGRQR